MALTAIQICLLSCFVPWARDSPLSGRKPRLLASETYHKLPIHVWTPLPPIARLNGKKFTSPGWTPRLASPSAKRSPSECDKLARLNPLTNVCVFV